QRSMHELTSTVPPGRRHRPGRSAPAFDRAKGGGPGIPPIGRLAAAWVQARRDDYSSGQGSFRSSDGSTGTWGRAPQRDRPAPRNRDQPPDPRGRGPFGVRVQPLLASDPEISRLVEEPTIEYRMNNACRDLAGAIGLLVIAGRRLVVPTQQEGGSSRVRS